jgi:hypothetical protein
MRTHLIKTITLKIDDIRQKTINFYQTKTFLSIFDRSKTVDKHPVPFVNIVDNSSQSRYIPTGFVDKSVDTVININLEKSICLNF